MTRLALDYLAKCGKATRADLDDLLLCKLPDVLTDAQKASKLKNLLQAMRCQGLVHTQGPRAHAQWLPGLAKDLDLVRGIGSLR